MKQVILDKPNKTASVSECCESLYYGVNMGPEKGFIRSTYWGSSTFKLYSLDAFTRSNSWSDHVGGLQKVIEGYLNDDYQIYEFQTPQELMAWLAEE